MKSMPLIAGASMLGLVNAAWAIPGNLPAGGQISNGGASLPFSPPSMAHNPALLFRTLATKDRMFHGVSLPAFALELGEFDDDFVDRLDQLERDIDALENDQTCDDGPSQFQACQQEAQRIENEFDAVMVNISDSAQVNIDAAMPLPALPVVFRALDGFMAVNLEGNLAVSTQVLSSGVDANVPTTPAEDFDIETDTAAYVKSASFAQLGVAYGRKLLELPAGPFIDGEVYAGGRLKLMQGSLSRQIVVVDDDDNSTNAFDRVEDNYDANEKTTSAVDLDLGVGYMAKNFSVGLTLRNVLGAEFDFKSLGDNCTQFNNPAQQQDCQAANYYTDQASGAQTYAAAGREPIPTNESYKLDLQPMLEASYTIGETGLTVLGSYELTAAENISGNEYQWAHLGVSYTGPWWAPTMRLGYKRNLADNGMDIIAVGINLFRFVSLEAFQATETGEFDGDEYPRAVGVSVGITSRF